MPDKITEMYAFVVVGEDGNEGIPAFCESRTNMMMPMVGADMHRVYSLLPIARRMLPGGFKILRLSQVEDITQAIMDNG